MILSVVFLISCIITARVFDKRKMHVASVLYTTLFVLMSVALVFVTDIEPVRNFFADALGAHAYSVIRSVLLSAIHSSTYGTAIAIAIILTAVLQLVTTVVCVVSTIIGFFKKSGIQTLAKKMEDRLAYPIRALLLARQINLLYCRMLN